MRNTYRQNRFWAVVAILIAATVLLHAASRSPKRPLRQPLTIVPLSVAGWRGNDVPIENRLVAALGVDDYLNRVYTEANGNQLELYVGYFGSQRSGELIHSPKNCLPAAGWEWVRKDHRIIPLPNHTPIEVNDFGITKGLRTSLVLYWYQGRGRAIANEYKAKFWMITDAMFRRRTDGSLVRIIIPIQNREAEARAQGIEFLQAIFPFLDQSIPE